MSRPEWEAEAHEPAPPRSLPVLTPWMVCCKAGQAIAVLMAIALGGALIAWMAEEGARWLR